MARGKRGGGKHFEVCENCGKKGVYLSNGYPDWGDGTERCRYCYKRWLPEELRAKQQRGNKVAKTIVVIDNKQDSPSEYPDAHAVVTLTWADTWQVRISGGCVIREFHSLSEALTAVGASIEEET